MSNEQSDIPLRSISLVAVEKSSDLIENIIMILKMLFKEQVSIVLLLSNRPVRHFLSKANELNLNLASFLSQKQLSIVDLTSRHIGDRLEDIPNAFYVSSPSDISEIALVVSDALSSMQLKGEKIMLVDSVSTLTLYNTTGGILRFLHFLLSKLRVLEFGGLIIIIKDELLDPMVQSLKQYCDNLFILDDGKIKACKK